MPPWSVERPAGARPEGQAGREVRARGPGAAGLAAVNTGGGPGGGGGGAAVGLRRDRASLGPPPLWGRGVRGSLLSPRAPEKASSRKGGARILGEELRS